MTGSVPFQELSVLLIESMASVCGQLPCVYVSGPLTSCRELYLGEATPAHPAPQGEAFEARNRERMQAFAEKLRGVLSNPVIDPGLLRVTGWTGGQYSDFFLQVLERFCREVWFLDGWAFSRGASKEFVRAKQLGLTCLDVRGGNLDIASGIELLEEACHALASRGIDEPRFRQRVVALSELTGRAMPTHNSSDKA